MAFENAYENLPLYAEKRPAFCADCDGGACDFFGYNADFAVP
jgi:hypothetical protein